MTGVMHQRCQAELLTIIYTKKRKMADPETVKDIKGSEYCERGGDLDVCNTW